MQSSVERSILRGRIGGSLRAPGTRAPHSPFRGLVLPDPRDRLTLVDVAEAAGRPATGRHRLRRTLVRTMTVALMVLLALILTAPGNAATLPDGVDPPSAFVTR